MTLATALDPAAFRRELDGRTVELFRIEGKSGLAAWITNHGGRVVSLLAPDRSGELADVVLGHDALDDYLTDSAYLGALCGRCANRIAAGRFQLEGRSYQLARNDPPNHLHGGERGWDCAVWEAEARDDRLVLRHHSRDGDEGYPGDVEARVSFCIDEAALRIEFEARASDDTIVNPTHHGYFNLAGHASGSVLDQRLESPATRFCPTDTTGIPLGEERSVVDTPFDFRRPKPLGRDIAHDDAQLRLAGGYDHHLVIGPRSVEPRLAARLSDPHSGRICELWTTEPGFQLYTGNRLASVGKGRTRYGPHAGVCLEPQVHPDAVNQPAFPSPMLRPGETYRQISEYRFSVDELAPAGTHQQL